MGVSRINPETMYHNPVFTQVATVSSGMKLVFVGGQNGVTTDGKIIGNDIGSQTEQALKNVVLALDAAGATFDDVVKMNVYLVQGQSLQEAFAAATRVIPRNAPPSTISVLIVAGLANPNFLIEVEAVATVEERNVL